MTNLIRFALVLTLSLGCAGIHGFANGQTAQQSKAIRKAPTGSIAGRVTVRGKGKAGIVVTLRFDGSVYSQQPTFKNTTDADGNYRIAEVPAGSYQVMPAAPAYVLSDVTSFGARGKSVILTEGESVEGIDFSLVRGGVITGKITTADGRPAIEERVYLLPVDPNTTPRDQFQIAGAQTDDRGIYRMFGLAAGRYKVAAGQGEEGAPGGGAPSRQFFKQIFHPDVSDIARATVIEVKEGSETANVDVKLGRAVQTYAVSGRIVDGDNEKPVANVRVGLQLILEARRGSFGNLSASVNRQGEFRLENVTPGKYVAFLIPQPESNLRVNDGPFEVIDRDVEGLVFKTARGASLAGSISIENSDDKAVFQRLLKLRIEAYVESESPSFGHQTNINPDGSFRLTGLEPGKAHISLADLQRGPLKGFAVLRVERDGVVLREAIPVSSGEEITGVRVVVSYGNSSIHGVVKTQNGNPPEGARFFVQIGRAGESPGYLQPAQVDARGHFIVEGLAVGLYELTATLFTPGRQRGPQPVTRQQVNVTEGEITDVTIFISLDQKASPPIP